MGFVGRVKDSVLALFGYPTTQRPEQQMDSMIASMSVNLRKCKGQVAIVLASQKRLQEQLHQNMNMVTQYQVKALAAVGRGEEELARELLRKKRRYEQTVGDLKDQHNKHKRISDNLMETVRKLELKLEETKRNKLLLLTQKQTYETSRLIEDGMDGADGEYGFQEILENLEDDVNSLKYATQIGLDVEAERLELEGDTDEDEPLALPEGEAPDRATIDDELEALKGKLASGELEALEEAESGGHVIHLIEEDEDDDGGIEILSTQGVGGAGAEEDADLDEDGDEYADLEEEVAEEDEDPYEEELEDEDDEVAEDEADEYDEYEEDLEEEEEPPPPPPKKKVARKKKAPPPKKKARKKAPARRKKKAPPPDDDDDDDDDGIVFIT